MNILNLSVVWILLAALFQQQPTTPLIREGATVKISDHVYVIPDGNVSGIPNVGIVTGSQATLVIDTGLGIRNGQTVLREMEKVRRGPDVFVIATHFHSEHTLGEAAFPASAKIIRAKAQQQDMDEFGIQPNFGTRSPAMAELMKDAQLRRADEIFESEKILDLGGVRVHIMWYGGKTHTNGDTLIFVEGDKVLFAGDVVMNRRFLAFGSPKSSVQAWLSTLERLDSLHPSRIVPAHGEMGDGTLIEIDRTYLKAIQARVVELKREGRTADQAATTITGEFRTKYPDWSGSAGAAARAAYDETR